jgi:SRSO17 transposase
LGRGDKAAVVDFRLFLPESWVNDPARCEKAEIPEDQRQHRSKLTLALEMVTRAKARGLEFEWVLADAAYGCSNEFCQTLDKMGQKYLMDISAANRIWDADPKPYLPEKPKPTGRPETQHVPGNQAAKKWKAADWVKEHFEKKAREILIRKTTQGELRARVWVSQIWVWEKGTPSATRRILIAREMADGEIKISWTNAPEGKRWEELAYIQAQRHWVERTFQDCKSELGMAQYEVRKWRGWHHHMAMVSLAMLFVMKERIQHSDGAPLLSTRDIVELLEHYLPRRGGTAEEVMQDLVRRHTQRLRASEVHAKRQQSRRSFS